MKKIISKYNKVSFILVLSTTICNVLALFYNYMYKFVIDAITNLDKIKVWKYFWILILIQLFTNVFTLLTYDYYLKLFQLKVKMDLKNTIFKKLLSFDFKLFKRYEIGKLSTMIIEDVAISAEYVSLYYFMIVGNTIRFIITYVMLFSLDKLVGLIVLASIPLYFLSTHFSLKYIRRFSKEERENTDRLNDNFLSALNAFKTIKANRIEERMTMLFNKSTDSLYEKSDHLLRWNAIFLFIRNFLTSFLPLMVVAVAIVRIFSGKMTVGTIFSLMGFCDAVYIPLAEIMYFKSLREKAKPVNDRVLEVIDRENEQRQKKVIFKQGENYIKVKNLSYEINGRKILENINLEIDKNGLYLIKGDNGRGKTTFLNILSGILDFDKGEVIISTKNKESISYMIQENEVFNASRKSNVELFKDGNFNTKKEYFSIGQARLMVFDRMLFRDSDIYLIDEPFENLDYLKRQKVLDKIVELSKDHIVIMVNHNMYYLENSVYNFLDV
ncbi:MAG: ABC transporter ATP-binding protein [Tissierellia bacterium]|nr:ABC transporter ATP-binding protein [Tissierellia bacterium]